MMPRGSILAGALAVLVGASAARAQSGPGAGVAPVPVDVEVSNGPSTVVIPAMGASDVTCVSPCRVLARPGRFTFGTRDAAGHLQMASSSIPADGGRIRVRRGSDALALGGGVLITVGAVGTAGSLVVMLFGALASIVDPSNGGVIVDFGLGGLLASAGMLGAGIPMLVVGQPHIDVAPYGARGPRASLAQRARFELGWSAHPVARGAVFGPSLRF